MTIQQVITAINKEWNSASMVEFTIELDHILDGRLGVKNPIRNDLINNAYQILAHMISLKEKNLNPIICCVYAAVGMRVLSLYFRPNQESGWPSMGESVETLPWAGDLTKEKVLTAFLKSLEEDFNIEILSQTKNGIENDDFKFHNGFRHSGHDSIISFFKRYRFGSNNPIMTYLSILATTDRCVILEGIYNPNVLDSILSDKLLLAYVTSGKKELALKVIDYSIRNGENNMNIYGLKSKLDLGLAPTRNRVQRLEIYKGFLSKSTNPVETEFLNLCIYFCNNYYN